MNALCDLTPRRVERRPMASPFHPRMRPGGAIPERLPCRDCGVDTGGAGIGERYMVHFHLWDECGAGTGFLCIGCLEARLGRQLTGWDFVPCPLNTSRDYFRSDRLQARLGDLQLVG